MQICIGSYFVFKSNFWKNYSNCIFNLAIYCLVFNLSLGEYKKKKMTLQNKLHFSLAFLKIDDFSLLKVRKNLIIKNNL